MIPPRNRMMTGYPDRAAQVDLKAEQSREDDLKKSGDMLASHSARTVLAMAEEAKAGSKTLAAMFSSMAEAHRRAAQHLDRAAMLALIGGRPRDGEI